MLLALLLLSLAAVACASASGSNDRALYIGGIPDQDASVLQAMFGNMAEYLTRETGITVRYQPSADYAAVVTAYRQGDIHMAWFGGLTGVQARIRTPGSVAFAQRPEDAEFRSVFVARTDSGIDSLGDLRGRSFTFGSESSTSGHLMPRSFLQVAGLEPERDFRAVGYSGSHDASWKQVEAGVFDAAALNAAVWRHRVDSGTVDTSKVREFHTTGTYHDYHWAMRPDIDQRFGPGASQRIRDAIFRLDASNGGLHAEVMRPFLAQRFIPTTNDNYDGIENVARALGLIQD